MVRLRCKNARLFFTEFYYVVPERKLENFFEFKESVNFNHRNTLSISRIKIYV